MQDNILKPITTHFGLDATHDTIIQLSEEREVGRLITKAKQTAKVPCRQHTVIGVGDEGAGLSTFLSHLVGKPRTQERENVDESLRPDDQQVQVYDVDSNFVPMTRYRGQLTDEALAIDVAETLNKKTCENENDWQHWIFWSAVCHFSAICVFVWELFKYGFGVAWLVIFTPLVLLFSWDRNLLSAVDMITCNVALLSEAVSHRRLVKWLDSVYNNQGSLTSLDQELWLGLAKFMGLGMMCAAVLVLGLRPGLIIVMLLAYDHHNHNSTSFEQHMALDTCNILTGVVVGVYVTYKLEALTQKKLIGWTTPVLMSCFVVVYYSFCKQFYNTETKDMYTGMLIICGFTYSVGCGACVHVGRRGKLYDAVTHDFRILTIGAIGGFFIGFVILRWSIILEPSKLSNAFSLLWADAEGRKAWFEEHLWLVVCYVMFLIRCGWEYMRYQRMKQMGPIYVLIERFLRNSPCADKLDKRYYRVIDLPGSARSRDLLRLFCTPCSVVILVFNAERLFINLEREMRKIKDWLRLIGKTPSHEGMVMLVGTHCEKLNAENRIEIQRQVNEFIFQDPRHKDQLQPFGDKLAVLFDLKNTGGVQEIRKYITRISAGIESKVEKQLLSWLECVPLFLDICEKKSVMKVDNLKQSLKKELAAGQTLPQLSDPQQDEFIDAVYKRGFITLFPNDRSIKDIVVTNQLLLYQVLLEMGSPIVFADIPGALKKSAKTLDRTAILAANLFDHWLAKFEHYKELVIKLLDGLHLVCPLGEAGASSHSGRETKTQVFLATAWLPSTTTDVLWLHVPKLDTGHEFFIRVTDCSSSRLFYRLLAKRMRQVYKEGKTEQSVQLTKSFARFHERGHHYFLRHYSRNFQTRTSMYIQLRLEANRGRAKVNEFLKMIMADIEDIRQTYFQEGKVELGFQCASPVHQREQFCFRKLPQQWNGDWKMSFNYKCGDDDQNLSFLLPHATSGSQTSPSGRPSPRSHGATTRPSSPTSAFSGGTQSDAYSNFWPSQQPESDQWSDGPSFPSTIRTSSFQMLGTDSAVSMSSASTSSGQESSHGLTRRAASTMACTSSKRHPSKQKKKRGGSVSGTPGHYMPSDLLYEGTTPHSRIHLPHGVLEVGRNEDDDGSLLLGRRSPTASSNTSIQSQHQGIPSREQPPTSSLQRFSNTPPAFPSDLASPESPAPSWHSESSVSDEGSQGQDGNVSTAFQNVTDQGGLLVTQRDDSAPHSVNTEASSVPSD